MDIAAIFAFGLSVAISPGPNNAMLAASGAHYGYLRTLPLMIGILCGVIGLFGLMAVGLGAVIFEYPGVQTALKIAGGAFLLYLAWRIGTAPPPGSGAGAQAEPPRKIGFLEGLAFQAVNPKAWTYALSSLALFTTPGPDYAASAITLTAVLAVCGLISANSWTAFGMLMSRFLTSPARHRAFSITMALVTAGSAVMIIV